MTMEVKINTKLLLGILSTYSDDMPKGYDILLDFIKATAYEHASDEIKELNKQIKQ